MGKNLILIPATLTLLISSAVNAQVHLSKNSDGSVFLDNGKISLKLDKNAKATYLALDKDKVNLIDNLSGAVHDPDKKHSFYLDYYSHGVHAFIPEKFEIIQNDSNLVHISYTQNSKDSLSLEYHFILRENESGIYSYVVAKNETQKPVTVSELRTIYRFDRNIMNSLYNGSFSATPYSYQELGEFTKIQDETWRKPDGNVYSKYDLANYVRKIPFSGAYGHKHGAWLIHAGRDYFSGDDTKQDLIVHQDAIVLNYMTGSHFGTPDLIAPPGWSKLYGPWFVYLNSGSQEKMLRDVEGVSKKNKNSWPYAWMNDERYQKERGEVAGHVKGLENAVIILTSGEEQNDEQTLGFSYQAHTDKDGYFSINNIRPGTYQVDVYDNGGNETGNLYHAKTEVSANKLTNIEINHQSRNTVLWSIGKADRTAKEFNLGNKPRNWKWSGETPSDLTFTIGQDAYQHKWYYAQTKPGVWAINFKDKADHTPRYLNIAFSGASNSGMNAQGKATPSLDVYINNEKIKNISFDNDKSIYRGAMDSGKYHNISIPIDELLIKDGVNTVQLRNISGSLMYDCITLSK